MVEHDYCYMDDVGMGGFLPEDYETVRDGRRSLSFVKGRPTRDPDALSRKLYDDLLELCVSRALPCGSLGAGRVEWAGGAYQISWEVGSSAFRLGSDYIGPSTGWARHAGVADIAIGRSLLRGRTIGGHILWPRCGVSNSINSARGGTSSFCDRIDLTLLDLRRWSFGLECRLGRVWDANSEYLLLFAPEGKGRDAIFPNFIEFWHLQDFVDASSEPVLFADPDPLLWKRGANEYGRFMNANLMAIESRSERILRMRS